MTRTAIDQTLKEVKARLSHERAENMHLHRQLEDERKHVRHLQEEIRRLIAMLSKGERHGC